MISPQSKVHDSDILEELRSIRGEKSIKRLAEVTMARSCNVIFPPVPPSKACEVACVCSVPRLRGG